ncbi:MAG TPA: dihydroorotate dehydrogenase electron transfer subunit [Candidatus Aminicenantes bacterium]|nr:dihydroorotate dehydrogenase electron transfer subunit [Candidatus Aminicenantes bacterium]
MIIVRDALLREVESWGDHFRFVLDAPAVGAAARPGQFVMVKAAAGASPLLRRPLGVHDASAAGIELFFKVAGQGTEALSRKKAGDRIDLVGPLGRGFTVPADAGGRSALLVGGGRGIAPLYFLARELVRAGWRPLALYGGRSLPDIPLRGRFEAAGVPVLCSTDDGSFGFAGLVTELASRELGKNRPDRLYACGPDPMMKSLAAVAAGHGVAAEFSLESVMGCGIGACWGCVHRIKGEAGEGWSKICEEGPVFPGERILW